MTLFLYFVCDNKESLKMQAGSHIMECPSSTCYSLSKQQMPGIGNGSDQARKALRWFTFILKTSISNLQRDLQQSSPESYLWDRKSQRHAHPPQEYLPLVFLSFFFLTTFPITSCCNHLYENPSNFNDQHIPEVYQHTACPEAIHSIWTR